ncbi:hypothetical protein [Caballeronia sp. 15715]|uniref:zinc ribbon domain-containing protein n=1 Tax=unclassified Caballeronia TaxID=2646786 RepID=UPI0039E728BA
MNLLAFRTPVLYAACHRCGNTLTQGEEECPHCGADQSRALRAPNSVDFNSSNVMMMPGRMHVPYPSVPEEVDAAMNIARERARVVRRVTFGVAGGGLLAIALALNYAPGLRSPVVQRLAALPEPARTPAFVPVMTNSTPKAIAPASAAKVVAAAKPAPPIPVSAAKAPPASRPTPPALTYAAARPVTQLPVPIPAPAPTPIVATNPATNTATNPATEIIASIMNKLTIAAGVLRTEISTLAMSFSSDPATPATSNAPAPIAETTATSPTIATAPTTAAKVTNTPTVVAGPISRSPTNPPAVTPAPKNPTPSAPVTLAQDTPAAPPSTIAPTVSTPSLAVLPPAPSPTAAADVPIASHAPQPPALVEKELPKLSLPPVMPVIAIERPPVGSPGENLYFARLALGTNDLSAARKSVANVPADQVNSPEVQQIRDDLAQREAARDTAMQHARTCDRSASWRCARRYAKDALAIDSSYTDSRVFLKHVAFKIAEAKKAAENAQIQNAAIAQRGPLHPAPIREAVVIPAIPRKAPVASADSTPSTPSAPSTPASTPPHLFANPVARAPRETHVTHEAHETRAEPDTREPMVWTFSPVRNASTEASESKALEDNTPIRPAGRGEAH